ncbi:MAG: PKD domain-containing protein [Bacteroidetes bacterium]|nr:PKD domain-containing protein [Bacteroidota bacterium]
MKRIPILSVVLVALLFATSVKSQKNDEEILINTEASNALKSNYSIASVYFKEAYIKYPDVPKGILEAVSYSYTHFRHLTSSIPESCSGLPRVYGIMGLTLDGKNYFRNNLLTVAKLSGYTPDEIINNPATNVLAFASAFSSLKRLMNIESDKPEAMLPILTSLSELNIEDESIINNYTMNLYLYGILYFLNDPENQKDYKLPLYKIDFKSIFGEDNLKIFTSKKIDIVDGSVKDSKGHKYSNKGTKTACPDYNFSNCTWQSSPNHYTGWNGHTISAIAIHTAQGSYTGTISWFKNTSSSASTHYVVASNSAYAGQVTQMVNETNAAWHVGSQNYYAIGYEHEGYVNDVSWYTTTMYQTSANLTKDVCHDHSINPYQTFYKDTLDDGTALDSGVHNLGAEGSCTKVKGHQQFPGATHTDPGPNWHWNYYYKLINQGSPTATTYTAGSGTFYDTGGASANYGDGERKFWLIQPTGASSVTLSFSSFALEKDYDFLFIYNGTNEFAPLIGRYNTQNPGTVTASSGKMFIEFRSDCATNAAGWAASWTTSQPDNIAPTTQISAPGNWKTANFTASFTDADNTGGSGLEKSFYLVQDYNGTEWHANAQNGFFTDNFDSNNSAAWTIPTSSGNWQIAGGVLIQKDTSVGNSNIYASLNQNLSNRYIYQFSAMVSSAAYNTSQHRLGFHFFSDNGALSNRGNSYFIFFRQETSKLEFYKVTDDTFTMEKVVENVTTVFGQWHEYKIIFDRTTGKIDVYRDNIFLSSWTDPSPHTTPGNYVSFRTGNCKISFDDFYVYRSRYPSVTVTVGAASTNDIRYQNPSPSSNSAKINSIVNDVAGNLSTVASLNINVDWTTPSCVTVNDGIGSDTDTTSSLDKLSANWTTSIDANSGITKYFYAIGTTPGDSNIVGWTDNALNISVTKTGLSLTSGQIYYFSVRAINGAGLKSTCNSDGITVLGSTAAAFTMDPTSICEGDSVQFINNSANATSYLWNFQGGEPSQSSETSPVIRFGSGGTYNIQLTAIGSGSTDITTQQLTVNFLPVADFSAANTSITIPALAMFANNSYHASSYLWNFGDGSTSTEENPWHSYTTEGIYTVTLIAYNALCGSDTLVKNDYLSVKRGEGITEHTIFSDISIQPNPFSDNVLLTFSLDKPQNIMISLIDILGREIVLNQKLYSTGKHEINLSSAFVDLSKGAYTLKLSVGKTSFTKLLIKY